MPGAKWTPLYCGGGGIVLQHFLGKVLHFLLLASKLGIRAAPSLTANDKGRCNVADELDSVVVVLVDVVTSVT